MWGNADLKQTYNQSCLKETITDIVFDSERNVMVTKGLGKIKASIRHFRHLNK